MLIGLNNPDLIAYLFIYSFIHLFAENDIDGAVLMGLNNEDLIAMGISSVGKRKSILSQASLLFALPLPLSLSLSPSLALAFAFARARALSLSLSLVLSLFLSLSPPALCLCLSRSLTLPSCNPKYKNTNQVDKMKAIPKERSLIGLFFVSCLCGLVLDGVCMYVCMSGVALGGILCMV